MRHRWLGKLRWVGDRQRCEYCRLEKAFFSPDMARARGVDTAGRSTVFYLVDDQWVPKRPPCKRSTT
jgi:hypothetical protein